MKSKTPTDRTQQVAKQIDNSYSQAQRSMPKPPGQWAINGRPQSVTKSWSVNNRVYRSK